MQSIGPTPGRLIAGRYRLGAIIGRGGMGVVWRARDELLNREVAVKELVWPAYFSAEERQAACRRATREAQLAARLTHRNVIRIFDIVEENGCPWIVMEFVAYRSLRDLIKEEGPLSPSEAAEVGLGILAALRAAHEEGIVHRDVKPANILMAPDRVVLTDFGIARAAGTSALTTVGELIGSPSYISPERARGGQSGAAGDLWGLGALLYAAVEGHGPFDRDGGALASLTAVVADEPAPAPRAGPLWPVISGLLRKDPDERLDAAEAERMLRDVATTLMAAAPVGPAVPVTAMAPRRRRSRSAAVALAGTTALAAIAVSGTGLGLVLTSAARHETAPAAAGAPPSAAASVAAPAASARPSTAASTSPHATAKTQVAARTIRAHPARSSASRAASVTASSGTGEAGNGAAGRGWPAAWAGRLAFYIRYLGWRSHPVRWPWPGGWGRTRGRR
jgi:tRNA A-37 threonylcarbamoyl transferase component Bud32